MTGQNPLIPSALDVAWSAITVVAVCLAIVALITLIRNSRSLTSVQALWWAAIVLLLPILGPTAWLLIGRTSARGRASGVS